MLLRVQYYVYDIVRLQHCVYVVEGTVLCVCCWRVQYCVYVVRIQYYVYVIVRLRHWVYVLESTVLCVCC